MVGQPLPASLAAAGASMLEAAVSDFVCAGCRVVTTLDRRAEVCLEGAQVVHFGPDDQIDAHFDRLASTSDATLVIAPETDGLLERFTARLERLGVKSLGCSADAVRLCADKMKLAAHFEQNGVPTPQTVPLHAEGATHLPAVLKPRFGAGCEDTFFCGQVSDIVNLSSNIEWIVQPCDRWDSGLPASASLVVGEHATTPLLAGSQTITSSGQGPQRLSYGGGRIPLEGAAARRAMDLARRAVCCVEGLRGFVGVDLILAPDPKDDEVLEINPRLTVSYVALRRLCSANLASAILSAAGPDVSEKDPLVWRDEQACFDAAGIEVSNPDFDVL